MLRGGTLQKYLYPFPPFPNTNASLSQSYLRRHFVIFKTCVLLRKRSRRILTSKVTSSRIYGSFGQILGVTRGFTTMKTFLGCSETWTCSCHNSKSLLLSWRQLQMFHMSPKSRTIISRLMRWKTLVISFLVLYQNK